jgi:23S rRNA pseudouridine2605 synthase
MKTIHKGPKKAPPKATPAVRSTTNLVRLHKFIADCGVASRRKAEELVAHGEVTVNGEVIREMGYKIIPGKDAVKVKGKLLHTASRMVYIALYKPSGVLTTLHDPQERPTVKDLLVGIKDRVFPVGRLDYDSEGLVLMTNDGEYAQSIIHPDQDIKKVYVVKLSGKPEPRHLERLRQGVTLAEGRTKPLHIEKMRTGDQYDWYKVTLTEGKNQAVRRMFQKIGFDVIKLKRVAIGRLTLSNLQRGEFRLLTKEQADLVFKS